MENKGVDNRGATIMPGTNEFGFIPRNTSEDTTTSPMCSH